MSLKKYVINIAVGIVMIVVFLNVYNKDLWDRNEELLRKEVLSLDESVELINLLDMTPFEWDMIYSFDPYTSKEKIYETVGYKWDHINETVSEGMNQIVFMKDENVVCYLYGYPENNGYGLYVSGEGFNNVSQVLTRKDHLTFHVKRSDGYVYLTNE